MEPRIQKWRDYFAECEAEQLRKFPLHELETPIERAQYEIAGEYFQNMCDRNFWRERVVALSADNATRHAFFDFFGPNKGNLFCFQSDKYQILLSKWRRGPGVWPFQSRYHEFNNCGTMGPAELHQRFGETIEAFASSSLYLRRYGFRDASQAGMGGSDLWNWNGTTLELLPKFSSRWIS